MDIFEAIEQGNLIAVQAQVKSGIDLEAYNPYGFTALHEAAVACNRLPEEKCAHVLNFLLEAGASVETLSKNGRTALFLATEFSHYLAPVKRLIEAGSTVDIRVGGNHIVENCMRDEVRAYLIELTGFKFEEPQALPFEEIKLSAAEWRSVKKRLNEVFEALEEEGLIALQDAGTTQDDGFADCAELYTENGGAKAGLKGFCFYSRQDQDYAKQTSLLSLAFWGAPDGNDKSMINVGKLIVSTFAEHGFDGDWDGTASSRPVVYLQER